MRRLPLPHIDLRDAPDTLALPADAAHYLLNVLRLKLGAHIEVFDGSGHSAHAAITHVEATHICLTIQRDTMRSAHNESPLHLTLVLALLRAERWEWALEKAAELGVNRVIPLAASRCVVQLDDRRAASKIERWQKIAAAASRQCERAAIPIIEPVMSLPQAIEATEHTARLLAAERAQGVASASRAAREALDDTRGQISLWIGPEGGWDAREFAFVADEAHKLRRVHLGPRILRAETAAAVGCALIQAAAGDLEER
jgi:16S rRNA (uracil1498-N3)-methyltransferase